MRLSLPEKTLRDDMVWGSRSGFDDEAYLRSCNSPRWDEPFGNADRLVADGRQLDVVVHDLYEQTNVSQPLVSAKFVRKMSFLSAQVPPGKGYKAPLGFDCPDNGRDPRP